jgi:hypothetical protein
MIIKRFATVGLLIALVFILLFSSPVDAQTYFSDDFENPADSEGKWEVVTGDWQVADGVYHQLATADPWQASMIAADQWSNEWEEYTIEFMVKPLTEGDAPVNVLFRVRDPVPQVWADRDAASTYRRGHSCDAGSDGQHTGSWKLASHQIGGHQNGPGRLR